MNPRERLAGCKSLLLIAIIALLLLIFGPAIREEVTVFQRTQDFSGVESTFDATFNGLPQSASDTLITVRTIQPLSVGRGLFIGCIRGSRETVYGSTREFESIIDEYEVLFGSNQLWVQNNERTGYSSKNARFWLYTFEPSDDDYPPECSGFPLCYTASLDYADPSIDSCSG